MPVEIFFTKVHLFLYYFYCFEKLFFLVFRLTTFLTTECTEEYGGFCFSIFVFCLPPFNRKISKGLRKVRKDV